MPSQTKNKDHQDAFTTSLLIWGVPKAIKRRFKAACQLRNVAMKEQIMVMMIQYANEVL